MTIVGDKGKYYWGTVEDNDDGTYMVSYTLPTAGTYQLSITLLGEDDKKISKERQEQRIRGTHIQDSPMEIWIDDKA